jgi:hypothetical protein
VRLLEREIFSNVIACHGVDVMMREGVVLGWDLFTSSLCLRFGGLINDSINYVSEKKNLYIGFLVRKVR